MFFEFLIISLQVTAPSDSEMQTAIETLVQIFGGATVLKGFGFWHDTRVDELLAETSTRFETIQFETTELEVIQRFNAVQALFERLNQQAVCVTLTWAVNGKAHVKPLIVDTDTLVSEIVNLWAPPF